MIDAACRNFSFAFPTPARNVLDMTARAAPGPDESVTKIGGGWVPRVCAGVVAILLAGAIVYGIVIAIANYSQVAV